jgi:hypothetical protein
LHRRRPAAPLFCLHEKGISDFGFSTHPSRVEPQRHRGTEKTQSHPHRKHEDTKTRRHHEGITKPFNRPVLNAKAQSPPLTHSTQRRRGAESPRGFTALRGPSRRRTTAGDRWVGQRLRTQALVAGARPSGLRSRRAQASPHPLSISRLGRGHLSFQLEGGQAEPTRHRCGASVRRSPFAAFASLRFTTDGSAPPHLCASAPLRPFVAPCRLRVFVSSCLRRAPRLCVSSLCVPSLCLCASVVQPVSGLAWRRARTRTRVRNPLPSSSAPRLRSCGRSATLDA